MRCCCARTLNLNRPALIIPFSGEHNERDHPADSRSGPLRGTPRINGLPDRPRHAARDIGFFI